MVQITQEDRDRATEAIERIDAAPAERGGTPVVTSNTDVAHGIIATVIAETREDAGVADCSEVEALLADSRDRVTALNAELAQVKTDLAACQASSTGDCALHLARIEELEGQLTESERLLEMSHEELAKITEAAQSMAPRARVFNHLAGGFDAMFQLIAQDKAAQANADEASDEPTEGQEYVAQPTEGTE